MTAGQKFRAALAAEKPLQLIGTVNAYVALMAQKTGYKAIYLSGAGVANNSYGLPDLAVTTLDNVLEDTRRITERVDIPLIVDIDTGWGTSLMIERTIKLLIAAGAAGVHIEDQVFAKKCGHLAGKKIVSIAEMQNRIEAVVEAKTEDFVLIARTDAFASEGMPGVLKRAEAYRDAGADIIFPEALTTLEQFKKVKDLVGIPIIANLTEFGVMPQYNLEQLREADIDIALYPLSVTRAMNRAAQVTLQEIRKEGTQAHLLGQMQTRQELYKFLDYESYEKRIERESSTE